MNLANAQVILSIVTRFSKPDAASSIPISRTSFTQVRIFPDRKSVERHSYIVRALEALRCAVSMYGVLIAEGSCGSVVGRQPD